MHLKHREASETILVPPFLRFNSQIIIGTSLSTVSLWLTNYMKELCRPNILADLQTHIIKRNTETAACHIGNIDNIDGETAAFSKVNPEIYLHSGSRGISRGI